MSTNLYEAAAQGDLNQVRSILAKNKADKFKINEDTNQYAFMYALEFAASPASYAKSLKENREQIFYLLQPDFADAEKYHDGSGNTMVHYLIRYQYEGALQYLQRLAKNNDNYSIFFKANNFGQKPIHYAIMHKQDKIFTDLLALPGMLDPLVTLDWNNRNLLHHIAHYGTPTMLREYWAKLSPTKRTELINAVDMDGKTPYQLAKDCNSTNDRLELMDMLATYGATIPRSISPFT